MSSKRTAKDRKFLSHLMKHHNLGAAARYAGSTAKDGSSLSEVGSQMLDRLEISFQERLNAFGLTDEFLMKKLLEGCIADKVEIATFQGKIRDEKTYADMPTRSKYLEMLSRMKGVFVEKHELTGKDGGDIILVVNKAKHKGIKELSFD